MGVIGVCSSGQESSVESLLCALQDHLCGSGDKVRFIQLPYNDLDSFELARGTLDGIVLCHSIHNRRFSITDVCDALYDEFLPRMSKTFGRENVAVIAHDFPWLSDEDPQSVADNTLVKEARLASFRIKQPTTFTRSTLVLISGRLDTTLQMDEEDKQKLGSFATNLHTATTHFKVTKLTGMMYELAFSLFQQVIGILLIVLLVIGPPLWRGMLSLFSKVALLVETMKEYWIGSKGHNYTKLTNVASSLAIPHSRQLWSQMDGTFMKTVTRALWQGMLSLSANIAMLLTLTYTKLKNVASSPIMPCSVPHWSQTAGNFMKTVTGACHKMKNCVCRMCASISLFSQVCAYGVWCCLPVSMRERVSYLFVSLSSYTHIQDCAGWLYGMIASLSILKECVQNSCNVLCTMYISINKFVWMMYSLMPSYVTVKESFRSYLSSTAQEMQEGKGSGLMMSVTMATEWLKTKLQTCLYLFLWLPRLPFLIPCYMVAMCRISTHNMVHYLNKQVRACLIMIFNRSIKSPECN